jgi:hypothetical protein
MMDKVTSSLKFVWAFLLLVYESVRLDFKRHQGYTYAETKLESEGESAVHGLMMMVRDSRQCGLYTEYEAGIEEALRDFELCRVQWPSRL